MKTADFIARLVLFSCFLTLTFGAYDLIKDHDWEHFSGASYDHTTNSIKIFPLDRKIRPKITGKFFDNPPINLYGPYITFNDQFNLTITIDVSENPTEEAWFDLYGKIPTIYDEWILSGQVLRIGIRSKRFVAIVNNNQQFNGKTTIQATSVEIKLVKTSEQITFTINDGEKLTISDYQLFDDEKIFFGADASSKGGYTITSLSCEGNQLKISDNSKEVMISFEKNPNSLRAAAEKLARNFLVGSAIHYGPLMTNEVYREKVATEFNYITTEIDMKPQNIHPKEDAYAFNEADAIIEFAEKNDIKVHGHCLVWHEANPNWMWDIVGIAPGNKNEVSKPELREKMTEVMTSHIKTIMGRYKGRIFSWDVINEPFSDWYQQYDEAAGIYGLRNSKTEDDCPASIWYTTIGPDFLEIALRTAKETDPGAKLFINEVSIEYIIGSDEPAVGKDKLSNFYTFVKKLKDKGVPLDGIGIQHHVYEDGDIPPFEKFKQAVELWKNIGIQLRISEFDALIDEPKQSNEYYTKMKYTAQEENFIGFTTWGFTDLYGSTSSPTKRDTKGNVIAADIENALYLDQLFKDKNSYTQARKALLELSSTEVMA